MFPGLPILPSLLPGPMFLPNPNKKKRLVPNPDGPGYFNPDPSIPWGPKHPDYYPVPHDQPWKPWHPNDPDYQGSARATAPWWKDAPDEYFTNVNMLKNRGTAERSTIPGNPQIEPRQGGPKPKRGPSPGNPRSSQRKKRSLNQAPRGQSGLRGVQLAATGRPS